MQDLRAYSVRALLNKSTCSDSERFRTNINAMMSASCDGFMG